MLVGVVAVHLLLAEILCRMVVTAGTEQHLLFLVHLLLMPVVAVEEETIYRVLPEVLEVLGVVALVVLAAVVLLLLELQIEVVAVEVHLVQPLVKVVALG
jgi:hypothetical protein